MKNKIIEVDEQEKDIIGECLNEYINEYDFYYSQEEKEIIKKFMDKLDK